MEIYSDSCENAAHTLLYRTVPKCITVHSVHFINRFHTLYPTPLPSVPAPPFPSLNAVDIQRRWRDEKKIASVPAKATQGSGRENGERRNVLVRFSKRNKKF